MHDPNTVAFEIRSPFKRRGFNGKLLPGEPILTIWHRDPERHGDDDSCGWSFVRLSPEDREWAEKTAKSEWSFWFSTEFQSINHYDSDDLPIVAAAWAEVRRHVTGRHRRDPLSAWDLAQVFALLTSSADNFRHVVQDARSSQDGMARMLALTLRVYRTERRPWWQHPKWHVHHWRLQFRPLQRFSRWMWSRCAGCGGRFRWGYCPTSDSWHGEGPRLFRGEKGVWHRECHEQRCRAQAR